MATVSYNGILSFSRSTNSIGLPPKQHLRKNQNLRVRSMADGPEDVTVNDAPEPPRVKPAPRFSQILAFSGPGPERINGRLAMIGFVAAIGVELINGQDLGLQLRNGGVSWFLGTTALLTVASLVPLLKGVTAESGSGKVMSSDAELWNGTFAMVGLVALAFTEFVKGGALV